MSSRKRASLQASHRHGCEGYETHESAHHRRERFEGSTSQSIMASVNALSSHMRWTHRCERRE